MSESMLLTCLLSILFLLFIALTERKIFAYVMRRVGPVLMGRNGAFQIAADLIKFLTKEIFFMPRPSTTLAPIFITLLWTSQLWFTQNFVWGPSMFIFEGVDSMILYHLVLMLFADIFFSVVGLLSQSRYAMLSVVRALVHVISLDIFITIVYSLLVFSSQSANFHDFVLAQSAYWFFFLYAPAASGFVVMFILESKSTPFDHAETEAEVVAGYATEYSGGSLLLIYLCEYFHLLMASVHFILFFMGGWFSLEYLWFLPALFIAPHDVFYWAQLFKPSELGWYKLFGEYDTLLHYFSPCFESTVNVRYVCTTLVFLCVLREFYLLYRIFQMPLVVVINKISVYYTTSFYKSRADSFFSRLTTLLKQAPKPLNSLKCLLELQLCVLLWRMEDWSTMVSSYLMIKVERALSLLGKWKYWRLLMMRYLKAGFGDEYTVFIGHLMAVMGWVLKALYRLTRWLRLQWWCAKNSISHTWISLLLVLVDLYFSGVMYWRVLKPKAVRLYWHYADIFMLYVVIFWWLVCNFWIWLEHVIYGDDLRYEVFMHVLGQIWIYLIIWMAMLVVIAYYLH